MTEDQLHQAVKELLPEDFDTLRALVLEIDRPGTSIERLLASPALERSRAHLRDVQQWMLGVVGATRQSPRRELTDEELAKLEAGFRLK